MLVTYRDKRLMATWRTHNKLEKKYFNRKMGKRQWTINKKRNINGLWVGKNSVWVVIKKIKWKQQGYGISHILIRESFVFIFIF